MSFPIIRSNHPRPLTLTQAQQQAYRELAKKIIP